jgi:twitching motility protein PilT
LENLGFSANLGKKLLDKKSGLIIVGGPTGSGKSTTLSSLLYEFGKIYPGIHIVTLEDPVEYILSPEGCLVTQKQVPVHVRNWEDGIHQAKREKPDLIVIGELRSKDAIRAAVEAAGSGHLVMATMFADRVPRVFEAIKDAFESEEQEGLKQKLSYLTRGVICQALVPTNQVNEQGYGLPILVYETLVNDVIAVESSLRKGTWGSLEIRSIEGQSASSSWESRIDELLNKGTITKTVIEYLKNK